jgi:hypothetical protein
MMHLDDQAIIQILMKEMDLPRDKAAEYLDRHNPSRSLH